MKKVSWISKLVLALMFLVSFSSVCPSERRMPGSRRRPIEFIIPAGAGGGADVMARFIAPLISKYNLSPKPFIVINKSGGAGAEGFHVCEGERKRIRT